MQRNMEDESQHKDVFEQIVLEPRMHANNGGGLLGAIGFACCLGLGLVLQCKRGLQVDIALRIA